jgi:hypothetical protein
MQRCAKMTHARHRRSAWRRALLGHLVGMFELQADPEERARQLKNAAETAAQTGGLRLDAMTALQVREHAHLTTDQLKDALRRAAPRGLTARRATTAAQRVAVYSPDLPGPRNRAARQRRPVLTGRPLPEDDPAHLPDRPQPHRPSRSP